MQVSSTAGFLILEQMESFFDFNTCRSRSPVNRDSATSGAFDSEGEYDAHNDETFGDLDKGDWENMHETLVEIEKSGDNEIDLSFDLEDCGKSLSSSEGDLALNEDIGSFLRLDPSIWNSPMGQSGFEGFPPTKCEALNVVQTEMTNRFENNRPQAPVMLSVEDIERNLLQQQQHDYKSKAGFQWEAQKDDQYIGVIKPMFTPLTKNSNKQPLLSGQLVAVQKTMFPPPPLLNHQSRIPVGFLPYNFLPTQYLPPIDNLGTTPGFSAGFSHRLRLVPRIPLPIDQNQIQNIPNNQFNNKLVQEIQQNHPMLSFYRQQSRKKNKRSSSSNVSRKETFDEYDNMMSNREKQWLIGIQLTQLNADTPYINDYYFTIYKQRLAASRGVSLNESKAYKDNRLNHPFTQPKGNAQLMLMASLTRNCDEMGHHERKPSESTNSEPKDQQVQRFYTPLQFENSLGKIQCGSVIAPRKLIDMDVVGHELSTQSKCAELELSMQRKSRHILLHIETLYIVVLKMEDLNNPRAIEDALIVKGKRDNELSLQQRDYDQTSDQPTTVEPHTFEDLLAVLMGGLAQDRVIPMLAVRKGKMLLRRICVLLRDNPCRWNLWKIFFSAIPYMTKKDRDDKDGIIFDLCTEFERQVQHSRFSDLLKLAQIIETDKVLCYLTCCKFLLSSIIVVIFQMEVFVSKRPSDITSDGFDTWMECLSKIMSAASKLLQIATPKPNAHHTVKIKQDNNILRNVRTHLERLPGHVKINDFLDFITEETPSSDNAE